MKLDLLQKLFFRGRLRLHLQERKVEYDGRKLVLGELSFKLLSLLAEQAPSTVSFECIEKEVWAASVTRETVKQRVKLLRDDLSRIGLPSGAIEAMRNSGYRLTISAQQPPGNRASLWALGAFAVLLSVGAAVLMLISVNGNSQMLTLAIKDEAVSRRSYGAEWIGIRQTLTRDLTRLDGVMVLDSSAGKADRSDLLVTLTPYRQGNENRYSVQLIDTRTAFVLWAENYGISATANDRAGKHAANYIQSYVAALGGDLGTAGYPAQSPEVQQSYMIALKYWRRGDEANLLSAQTRLRNVVEAAPGFELATSLLARVESDLVLRHGYSRNLAMRGKSIMQELLRKHPDFADFRYSMARAMLALGDREGALAELRRAEPSMPFLIRDIRAIEVQLGQAT